LHEAAKKARGGLDAPNNPELAETDQRGINLTLDNDSRIEDLYSHIEVARNGYIAAKQLSREICNAVIPKRSTSVPKSHVVYAKSPQKCNIGQRFKPLDPIVNHVDSYIVEQLHPIEKKQQLFEW
jgi:hypothetical protein